jgi:hypothetical protein
MICFIVVCLFIGWCVVEFIAWVLSLIFTVAMGAVWVAKVAGVCLILSFLVDIFTSYKGNKDWY